MGAKPTGRLTDKQRLGRQGEDQALAHLERNGLALVERNFRCKGGEIDLIMGQRGGLVFVEVRQRSGAGFGGAVASVTPAKQRRLVLAAQLYLQRLATLPPCRFDLVTIDAGQLRWLQNVLQM